MPRFKLITGVHEYRDAEGKNRSAAAGQVIDTGHESPEHQDLVRKFGPERFQLLEDRQPQFASRKPGDPAPDVLAQDPQLFPNGQVSTGFQQARTPDPAAAFGAAGGTRPSEGLDPEAAKKLLQAEAAEGGGPIPKDIAPANSPAPQIKPATLDDEYGPLDTKTDAELREIAETEEVSLKGCKSKADVLNRLRAGK